MIHHLSPISGKFYSPYDKWEKTKKAIKLKCQSRVITIDMIMNNKFCSKRHPVNNTVSLCDIPNKQTNMELLTTTVPKFYTYINMTYGLPVRRLINKLTRLSQTEARYENHRIFNIRCQKNEIIPKYLRLRAPVPSDRVRSRIEGLQKLCLKEEIHRIVKKLQHIRSEIEQLKQKIKGIVTSTDYDLITQSSSIAKSATFKKSKNSQIKKFNKLLEEKSTSQNDEVNNKKSTAIDKSKWVVNLSTHTLSPTEISVLEKGLNFNVSLDKLKPEDVIPKIEIALSGIDKTTADEVRAQCALTLKRQKCGKPNLTKQEIEALKHLKNNKDIVITKSDKGNATVVLDKSDYLDKVNTHIQTGPYEEINKPIDTVMNKVKKSTADLIRRMKPFLGESKWFNLMPKTNNPSRMYGVVKVHKSGYPIRPIVDFRNSPTYELSKYLAMVLNPLKSHSKSRLTNSYELKHRLDNLKLDNEEKMVSFDIVSLYTRIPINMAIEAVRNELISDQDLELRTKVPLEDIMLGVQLCLTSTVFKFQGKIYKQTEGVAMGSPISPVVADIFMNKWESIAIETFTPTPKVWWRYVDDTFTVLRTQDIDRFFEHINSKVEAIQFTYELENQEGELPMLDCNVKRKEDGKLNTSVYRKPTHSNRYLDFQSSHPMSVKVGLVKCLNDRAQKLSSTKENLNQELIHIKEALKLNNYPDKLVRKYVRKCKNKINNDNSDSDYNNNNDNSDNNNNIDNDTNNKESKSSVVIPYKEGTSEALRRILNKAGIKTAFKPTNSIRNKLCRLKDPVEPLKQSNLVYLIPCNDCQVKYIGQTSRTGAVRLAEHKNLAKSRLVDPNKIRNLENSSAIALHAVTHNHTIGWDRMTVLKSNVTGYRERLITEALFIESTANTCNRNDSSPVPDIWKILLPLRQMGENKESYKTQVSKSCDHN
ncbi:unnamed protein product [Trichobilharzia szidati]|nr:unnamed protein product [Trichobilharzia szidati]